MTQRGIAAALVTVGIVLAGCSGSSGSEPISPDISPTKTDVPSTSAPALLSLADACPKVQDALDANFSGGGAEPSDYRQFGVDIAALAEQTDPKGRNILETVAETSERSAALLEDDPDLTTLLAAREAFRDVIDRIANVCEQQGAPLK